MVGASMDDGGIVPMQDTIYCSHALSLNLMVRKMRLRACLPEVPEVGLDFSHCGAPAQSGLHVAVNEIGRNQHQETHPMQKSRKFGVKCSLGVYIVTPIRHGCETRQNCKMWLQGRKKS